MTDDVDHFYLPRSDQDKLVDLLDQIPALIEDLTIAITRQDRIGSTGPRVRNGSDEQPLPYSVNASEAADLLHDTLAAWVRHTCEHRVLNYQGRDDTLTLTRWLKRWIVALALSPGADEAPDEIRHAIHNARRACDRPPEKVRTVDHIEVHEAGEALLSATEIAKIAPTIDRKYGRLDLRRVLRLRDAGAITPAAKVDGVYLYRVGDVLIAHLVHPTRKRKAA